MVESDDVTKGTRDRTKQIGTYAYLHILLAPPSTSSRARKDLFTVPGSTRMHSTSPAGCKWVNQRMVLHTTVSKLVSTSISNTRVSVKEG